MRPQKSNSQNPVLRADDLPVANVLVANGKWHCCITMDIKQDQDAATPVHCKRTPVPNFERLKTAIVDLYIKQSLPLNKVQDRIFAEHGFWAS